MGRWLGEGKSMIHWDLSKNNTLHDTTKKEEEKKKTAFLKKKKKAENWRKKTHPRQWRGKRKR